MAANVEWDVPASLLTPEGLLLFNQPASVAGPRYLLVPQVCEMGADLRIETDNVPQGDGAILHHRFETGYACGLAVELWDGAAIACGQVAREMLDVLNLHVRALLNAGDNEGRFTWTPSGTADRMLDDVRQAARVTAKLNDEGCVVCTFAIDTAFPYAMTAAQEVDLIGNGSTVTLTNGGTTDFYPVIKMHGDFEEFWIGTDTLGSVLHWSDAYPGVGPIMSPDYIEIDFFRNTMFKNGDEGNQIGGVDFSISEFFPMVPGDNDITLVALGGSVPAIAEVLWQSAWS